MSLARLLAPARAACLLYRWRRRRKEGRSLRAGVGDPLAFFARLREAGIEHLVMQWFDEVPITPEACAAFTGDIDLLVGDQGVREVALAAALDPGPVMIEMRSVTGEMGSFGGMPYLPPAFARELLDQRVLHPAGFHVPAPEHQLPLFLFHLAYHEGEASGIPTGCEVPDGRGESDPAARLREVAAALGETLPEPLTLSSLHEDLGRRGRDMQLDLLERWPLRTPWIEYLTSRALAEQDDVVAEFPGLALFFVRSHVPEDLRDLVVSRIADQFDILEQGPLDEDARRRALRHLRGGNWCDDRGRRVIGPSWYLVCNDPKPRAVIGGPRTKAEEHLVNARMRIKYRIRDEIRKEGERRGIRCRHAVHTSDNPHEAGHMLEVVFGGDAAEKRAEFAARIGELEDERAATPGD